jgi:ribosomal protein S25
LWPLVPIGAAVFCLSALIYFRIQYEVVQVRSAMQVMIAGIYQAIGFAPAVMFFLLLLTWSSIWFVTGRLDRPLVRVGRLLAMAVMMGVFLNLGDGGVAAATHKGVVGAWLAGCLVSAIGYYPSIVLVWAVTFASLLLATDFFFSDSFERLRLRPRTEVGVEASVTDHLRGLGALAPVVEPMPRGRPFGLDAAAAMPATGAPELDFLRELQADEAPLGDADGADTDKGAAAGAVDDDQGSGSRRRRSYFDRRREQDEVEPIAARTDVDVTVAAEWGPETDSLDAAPMSSAAAVWPSVQEPIAEQPMASEGAGESHAEPQGSDSFAGEPEAGDVATLPPQQSFVSIEESPLATAIDGETTDDAVGEVELESLSGSESGSGLDLVAQTEDETEDEDEDEAEDEAEPVDAAAEPLDVAEPIAADRTHDAVEPDDSDVPESLVAIPRPDQSNREWQPPSSPRTPSRQQKLFAPEIDEDLLQEALDLVSGQSRVTAVLLQRRLRIDYQQAMDVLGQLGARGVVELDADASQGRVVV